MVHLLSKFTLGIAICGTCVLVSAGENREASFDGCRFTIADSYSGQLEVSEYSPPKQAFYRFNSNVYARHAVDVSIEFSCSTTLGQKAFSNMGISHNNGEWGVIPDKSDRENLADLKVYTLRGNGVDGAAITYVQTTGEEERRVQGIGFCLTDQKQILCGTSEAVGYVAYPQQSSLPKVLELLKSIKFLDPTE